MKRTFAILVVLVLSIFPALARPSSFAIGAQLGFLSTGVVVDGHLGPVALDIGANFPAGITYIDALSDNDDLNIEDSIFSMTADITVPINLGSDFSLKLGLGTTLFSDFSEYAVGLAGGVVKGEYWIKGGPFGLFVKMDLPLLLYAIGESSAAGGFNAALPLLGILTSTVGFLYAL
ncbi:MAG: hypothetical protein RBQ65_05295 [Sphaerochaeta sp.]|nr:hypothetical protein [Sphaerochaeta sp.]